MFSLKTDIKFDIDFYGKYEWISDTCRNSGIFLNVISKEQIGVRDVSGQKCDHIA